jgi:hypothetical protein
VENKKLKEIPNKLYAKNISVKKVNTKNYKIYTPEIVDKYKNYLRTISKINNNTKTKFIMYDRVIHWYQNEEEINLSMEKIYISTKLGSYDSGGCGIGASLLAGLTASSIFSYIDNYIKKLSPIFLAIYVVLILFFGIRILSNEDDKVEMYNMFLEVLNNLQNDKNDKIG